MINVQKLLKDCPKGTKLYSPLFGEVEFKYITSSNFGIVVKDSEECSRSFDKYGRYFTVYNNAECLLFPSKDCRTWENFKLTKFKFKVGDWIVRNDGSSYVPIQVYAIKNDRYLVTNMLGSKGEGMVTCQDECRLWTIQDAKDGDVLVSRTDNPFIYNGNIEFSCAGAYVGVSRDGKIMLDMFPSKSWTSIKDVKPAAKEQCDLLFTKLKELGYEWDAKKKELRKIKPHYDIANFHAGMPVLVRDYFDEEWKYVQFSHMRKLTHALVFDAGCSDWYQCIPFNDDTKHLLGTSDMCDEKYVNWQ